jgi:hypothetical protein
MQASLCVFAWQCKEANVVRIYISSTYSDLKECREKVYHKLRELQHDVIAMEDYVAADQRPLDKCLEDVAKSDLYVGLFAWRYGYIPPHDNPEHKSITELEYRKAIETGKSHLIFLLEEQVAWSPNDMDQTTGEGDQGKCIMELRKELKQERIISLFNSPDHLAGLVASAVTLWEKEHPLRDMLATIDKLVVQIAPMYKVLSDNAAKFAEEDVYPEQCNFVSDDLRTADQLIQELLDVVNHLPIPAAMLAGSLRFQLSKALYHAEALVGELIQLVAAFRPICRSGTRLTATKKNEIELKLRELAQNLDSNNKALEQLTESIQGKKTSVHPDVLQPQPVVSLTPAVQQVQPVPASTPPPPASVSPAVPAPVPIDNLTRLREIMFSKYDADEFKLLCTEMGTDYDELREGKLELKMYYLIHYCIRHGKYGALRQRMLIEFPDLQGQL